MMLLYPDLLPSACLICHRGNIVIHPLGAMMDNFGSLGQKCPPLQAYRDMQMHWTELAASRLVLATFRK